MLCSNYHRDKKARKPALIPKLADLVEEMGRKLKRVYSPSCSGRGC